MSISDYGFQECLHLSQNSPVSSYEFRMSHGKEGTDCSQRAFRTQRRTWLTADAFALTPLRRAQSASTTLAWNK